MGDPAGGGDGGDRAGRGGAVLPRAALLVLGVLLVHLAFILSYVGALHAPRPDRVALAVVAPAEVRDEVVRRLDRLPGGPLDPDHRAADPQEARRKVERREVDGALIVSGSGRTDTLLVASGGGAALAEALTTVIRKAEAGERRSVEVRDVAPAGPGDRRGLASFYLVVGWSVGGYLCAAALALGAGPRPAGAGRALGRLLVLALYAVAGGIGGAVLVGPVLDALPGRLVALAALGALVVFATGALTLALQALCGMAGIGLAILIVVVLGNPSAGGASPYPLLPPFWQAIGPALIPGAGVWTARSLAYFDGRSVLAPLLVLAAWAAGAAAVTVALARLRAGPRAPLDRLTFR
ncbi:membrane protein [Streptomyces sp. SBT349]|uniref:membrane protein n=1 Tax=Streptomyces sp. SBT349 TaxID=1580539 RepID=UPI00066E09FF|nr:membrane protein [Streptomyces sp. SBT349]